MYVDTESIELQGEVVCIFCGSIIKSNKYFDEYTECIEYICDCENAQKYLELKNKIYEFKRLSEEFLSLNKISDDELKRKEYEILKERFEVKY